MTGVCIGIGEGWGIAALRARWRMEQMTGLQCQLISWKFEDVSNPSWLKCHIHRFLPPETAPWLVFDADLLPMRPWNPAALYNSRFTAVRDQPTDMLRGECDAYGLDIDRYVNGGLLMFDASHAAIMEETWTRHPRYGRWLEQTSLNVSLKNKPVTYLPETFNKLMRPDREDISAEALRDRPEVNVHLCGLGGDVGRLLAVQEGLWGSS
jgi:hypothetical protein